MKVNTFQYLEGSGWSGPFPAQEHRDSLVIVFGSPSFDGESRQIRELCQLYPDALVIGCSTAGEILDTFVYDNSLSVALVQFEHTTFKLSQTSVTNIGSSFDAGSKLARDLAGDDLRGIFVLSDGLSVNGSELIDGLNTHISPGIPVTGGLAGDGADFESTWVLINGELCSGLVLAVGFYGTRIRIGHGSKGGWDIFGPERLITKAEGPTLFELDGKPALELYKTYLGERAKELPAAALLFPLALSEADAPEKQIVRTILSIDEESQSMTFAGNIPQGAKGQLMKANFDRLIDGAQAAAYMINVPGPAVMDVLAIAISCVGRRLVLGERTDEELEATIEVLPPGTHQIGFYSYGEISPYSSGQCDLHNQTMTLTTISEI